MSKERTKNGLTSTPTLKKAEAYKINLGDVTKMTCGDTPIISTGKMMFNTLQFIAYLSVDDSILRSLSASILDSW